MASCQCNKLLTPTQENWIVRNQQCVSPFLDDSGEGSIDFPFAACLQQRNPLPDRGRSVLYVFNVRLSARIAGNYE